MTPTPQSAEVSAGVDSEIEFLRAELAKARSYIRQLESSRGWRLIEKVRGIFGLRWRK
ncbi:MAG: hypothetical protein GY835_03285 [bacterium]|nr:hypothetical protein [bacterium]